MQCKASRTEPGTKKSSQKLFSTIIVNDGLSYGPSLYSDFLVWGAGIVHNSPNNSGQIWYLYTLTPI